MPLRTKVLGAAALVGTASYINYNARHPTLLEAKDGTLTTDASHLPTKPVSSSMTAYDTREEPMYLIPTPPTHLQHIIASTRQRANGLIASTDRTMRSLVDHIILVESRIESTVKGLKAKDERLMPGALYVGVIGLSGSIIARNRAFPIRFLTPVVLLVASASVLLPRTTRNVGDLVYSYESRVPELKRAHDSVRQGMAKSLWRAGEVVEEAEHLLDGAVQGSKDVFEQSSGIKLPK